MKKKSLRRRSESLSCNFLSKPGLLLYSSPTYTDANMSLIKSSKPPSIPNTTQHSPKVNMSTQDPSSMSHRHLTVSQLDAMLNLDMPSTPFINPTMPDSVSAQPGKASPTLKLNPWRSQLKRKILLKKTDTKSVQTKVSSSACKTSSTFDEN